MADVLLRAVVADDLPAFFAHQADAESARLASVPSRDRPAFDAHWERVLADDASVVRTVVADGEVAGNVLSWAAGGRRLVGYWLGRGHWGRGIATRALAAFVAELEERPLHATVARHNVASQRVLEKCGFRPEAPEDDVLVYVLER